MEDFQNKQKEELTIDLRGYNKPNKKRKFFLSTFLFFGLIIVVAFMSNLTDFFALNRTFDVKNEKGFAYLNHPKEIKKIKKDDFSSYFFDEKVIQDDFVAFSDDKRFSFFQMKDVGCDDYVCKYYHYLMDQQELVAYEFNFKNNKNIVWDDSFSFSKDGRFAFFQIKGADCEGMCSYDEYVADLKDLIFYEFENKVPIDMSNLLPLYQSKMAIIKERGVYNVVDFANKKTEDSFSIETDDIYKTMKSFYYQPPNNIFYQHADSWYIRNTENKKNIQIKDLIPVLTGDVVVPGIFSLDNKIFYYLTSKNIFDADKNKQDIVSKKQNFYLNSMDLTTGETKTISGFDFEPPILADWLEQDKIIFLAQKGDNQGAVGAVKNIGIDIEKGDMFQIIDLPISSFWVDKKTETLWGYHNGLDLDSLYSIDWKNNILNVSESVEKDKMERLSDFLPINKTQAIVLKKDRYLYRYDIVFIDIERKISRFIGSTLSEDVKISENGLYLEYTNFLKKRISVKLPYFDLENFVFDQKVFLEGTVDRETIVLLEKAYELSVDYFRKNESYNDFCKSDEILDLKKDKPYLFLCDSSSYTNNFAILIGDDSFGLELCIDKGGDIKIPRQLFTDICDF